MMQIQSTKESLDIYIEGAPLESIAQGLAEGEHDLGHEVSQAGYALIMWPNPAECPFYATLAQVGGSL